MDIALIFAMSMFSLSMSISPGPVNMVIVASGANIGFWRTFPFVSGATIGFTLLLIFVGFWFLKIVESYPVFSSTSALPARPSLSTWATRSPRRIRNW